MTPEELATYWNEYKKWVLSNPIKVQDFVGKDGEEVFRIKQRPLLQSRFYWWVKENKGHHIHQYFEDKTGAYDSYLGILTHIRNEWQSDQIEGGMVGIYDKGLTARINGLADKTESKVSVEQPLFPDVDK